ncbi:MAG: ECF-type sigma factor [Rubrivivax sp.]
MRDPTPAPTPDAAADARAAPELAQLDVLLAAQQQGRLDGAGADRLFALLYGELHRLARRELHRGLSGSTVSATTLLHETYLSLRGRGLTFPDRARFFAYAARAMRGLIVDHVRRRQALKRGGAFELTTLDPDADDAALRVSEQDLAPLTEALDALAQAEPALAELVELKVFGGLDLVDIAALRGVSDRTVQRHWEKARLYLRHALGPD